MRRKTEKKTPLWRVIFMINDKLHDCCDHLSNPEKLKSFHNMTITQVRVMKRVMILTEGNPEGIRLKELAEELELSPAATSELVNVLVQKNMLVREQDPDDRRALRLHLTKDMVKAIEKIHDYWDGQLEEFLSEIPVKEKQIFLKTLDKFLIKAEEMSNKVKK